MRVLLSCNRYIHQDGVAVTEGALGLFRSFQDQFEIAETDHFLIEFRPLDEHLKQDLSEVFAAQKVVSGDRIDFHDVLIVFKYRHIESTAAQIEDQTAFALSFVPDAIRDG